MRKQKKFELIGILEDSKKVNILENDTFYTRDTEAFLVFITEITHDFDSATIALLNRDDGSLISVDQNPVVEGVTEYKMPVDVIAHYGKWNAQVIYHKGEEDYTSPLVSFSVERFLADSRPPRLEEVESVAKLVKQAKEIMTEYTETLDNLGQDITKAEEERETAEQSRNSAEADRVANEQARESAEEQRKTDHANRSAEFDGKADKVVINNLVENGDFSDGLEGWLSFSSTNVVENNILKNTGDGEVSQAYLAYPFNFQTGDVYYIKAKARVTNPLSTMMLFGTSVKADVLNITKPIENKWYLVSGIIRATNDAQIRLRHYYDNPEVQLGKTMEVIEVQNINLTETFGAGNEPTKEEMDELIKITGYIDGEYALNNKEMLAHLMNGIREKADKVVLSSLTPSAIENWLAVYATVSLSNNEYALTVTTSSDALRLQARNLTPIVGHKYYISHETKPSVNTVISTHFGDALINVQGNKDAYAKTAVVLEPINTNPLRIYVWSTSTAIDDIHRIRNIMLFDLTDIFGAGNEPTKEEMDRLIEFTGYIDGGYTFNNKEMLGYLMDTTATEWVTPTLLNGFTGEVKYRISEANQLEIVGVLEYPEARTNGSVQVFTLPRSHVPPRLSNGSIYQAYTSKFEIQENSYYSFRTAKCVISWATNTVTMYHGGGGTKWEFNTVIPMGE